MEMNMKLWVESQIASPKKAPLPLLSFPCVQLMGVSVRDLLGNSQLQAEGMVRVAQRLDAAACVSFMDLSVEAEAFGSRIRQRGEDVPTVVGSIVMDEDDAEDLEVPEVGAARTGSSVEAVRMVASGLQDRPVLAGVIGPFSLAGRLLDVTEAMALCYEEPELVHAVLEKATSFIIDYCGAFKEAGANGVFVAEPLAGLLSPALAKEFSHPYMKRIVDAVQTDDFALFYHNCGNNVALMAEDIYGLGTMGYHFGDAVPITSMLEAAPADALVMGNISPAVHFVGGTPDSMKAAVCELLETCGGYPNFVSSSGCDIPPQASWENIDAFFSAASEYYAEAVQD